MDYRDDDNEQTQRETWHIISQHIAFLESPVPDQIDLQTLFTPPIYKTLASGFLQRQLADKSWRFLCTDQLVAIASKVESAEIDIDQKPGVYIFCCLCDQTVLKVGQSDDMRRRIANEHLRKATMNTDSLLIDYVSRRWQHESPWYECLREQEVTALIFPMYKCEKVDRLLVEQSLEAMLGPTMR